MSEVQEIAIWPFLSGRARLSGHRTVVAPEILTEFDLANVIGSRTKFDGKDPERVHLQQYRDPPEPLCAIFRVYQPTESDFALTDDSKAVLRDRHGRPIEITEGFIVAMPAADCLESGFTANDLANVHSALVPAYQAFWREEEGYQVLFSGSLVATRKGHTVALHVTEGETSAEGHKESLLPRDSASLTPATSVESLPEVSASGAPDTRSVLSSSEGILGFLRHQFLPWWRHSSQASKNNQSSDRPGPA